MNYKDINDKWKAFLFENTFKEDIVFNPEQEKKKKKKKKEKKAEKKKEDGKEIITNEFEEYEEENESLEEFSGVGGIAGYVANAFHSKPKKKVKKRKYKKLEEEAPFLGTASKEYTLDPELEKNYQASIAPKNPNYLSAAGTGLQLKTDTGIVDAGIRAGFNKQTGKPEKPSVVLQLPNQNIEASYDLEARKLQGRYGDYSGQVGFDPASGYPVSGKFGKNPSQESPLGFNVSYEKGPKGKDKAGVEASLPINKNLRFTAGMTRDLGSKDPNYYTFGLGGKFEEE
jgi:hypothetical protein